MKKNLFFLLALVACVLVGCEDPTQGGGTQQPEEVKSIRFEYDSVSLAISNVRGEQLILFPTVEATFISSDEAVATVDSTGHVYPVAEGVTEIIATYKDLTAKCVVTVIASELDLIEWTSLPLFGLSSSPISDEVYTLELVGGIIAECNLHMGTYYLMDNGLYVGTDKYLHGAGYLAQLEIPTCVISSPAQYEGYYVTLSGGYSIVTDTLSHYKDSLGCALGGNIKDVQGYGVWMDAVYLQGKFDEDTTGIQAAYDAYVASIEGAFICKYDANTGSQTVDLAMLKSGVIVDGDIDEDGQDDFEYQLEVEWLETLPTAFYGLEVAELTETEDGYYTVELADPYNLVTTARQYIKWDLSAQRLQKAPAIAPVRKQVAIQREFKPFKSVKALSNTLRVAR